MKQNDLLIKSGKRRISSEKGSRRKKGELDLIDRKIISALQRDGRLTINDLASKIGLSPSPCWARVKRLETSGVITGYAALIDYVAIGLRNIVFVEVTLEKHDDRVLEEFDTALSSIPEVVEANLMTGEYDYLVKVAVADTSDYERFLREKLYRIKGVRHTRSSFSLRSLKKPTPVDLMKLERPSR
jgi:Lrp/AsnC family leucine-responsive transcriptional regulator